MKKHHWMALISIPLIAASYNAAHISVNSAIEVWWFIASYASGCAGLIFAIYSACIWYDGENL